MGSSITKIDLADLVVRVRTHEYERYALTLFTPAAKRPALWALLAFHIEVAKTAEVVSEPEVGYIRLNWWCDAIDKLYAGEVLAHEVLEALALVVAEYDLKKEGFLNLIQAREKDLEEMPFSTLDDFNTYAEETAGGLLGLMADVLGVKAEGVRDAIGHAAIAHAIVGTIRALPFQVQHDVVKAPEGLLAKYELHKQTLLLKKNRPELQALVRELADLAEDHLQQAQRLGRMARRSERPLLLLTIATEGWLKRFEKNGYDPFDLPSMQSMPFIRMVRHYLFGF